MEVLKKIMNLLKSVLNMHVLEPANPLAFTAIQAAGSVNFKNPTQSNFPSNPAEMHTPISVPVMLTAEFFEEDKSEFKLSLRATDIKIVAGPIINLIKFYIVPN